MCTRRLRERLARSVPIPSYRGIIWPENYRSSDRLHARADAAQVLDGCVLIFIAYLPSRVQELLSGSVEHRSHEGLLPTLVKELLESGEINAEMLAVIWLQNGGSYFGGEPCRDCAPQLKPKLLDCEVGRTGGQNPL